MPQHSGLPTLIFPKQHRNTVGGILRWKSRLDRVGLRIDDGHLLVRCLSGVVARDETLA